MKLLSMQAILNTAQVRPADYVETVVSSGQPIVGDDGSITHVAFSEGQYELLVRMYADYRPKQDGPGTELKALLKDWLGIEASPTCSCNAMARQMNERGPEWCESDEGMAEILGVMRAEHAKRWEAGKTRLPWADIGARQLVRLACRRARAKASA